MVVAWLLKLLAALLQVAEGLTGLLTLGLWFPDKLTPWAWGHYNRARGRAQRRRAAKGRW